MHDGVVADAGGLLVVAGLLEGTPPETGEVVALDATSLLVAEYLSLRHEGAAHRARADFALACRVVHEWFPVRAIALDAALAARASEDVDGQAALALAEALRSPLVTKHAELQSESVPVLRC